MMSVCINLRSRKLLCVWLARIYQFFKDFPTACRPCGLCTFTNVAKIGALNC